MQVKTVGFLAAAGMLLTSFSVWSLTAPGGGQAPVGGPATAPTGAISLPAADAHPSFTSGQLLMMEGRLGHAALHVAGSARDARRETLAFINVSAPAATDPGGAAGRTAPLNLAIVIDRSGSMKGKRLTNALDAARGMVRRLRDGDVVSVVAYDTTSEVLVSSTSIDSFSRERVVSQLSTIGAHGETCISCGIDSALQQLRQRSGMVDRVLLLSDGEATAGVKDLDGFRRIAEQCRRMEVAISSIGVDVDYNERVMSVLARESNGRSHFVENADALPRIFDEELQSLERTLAKNSELSVELPAGVHVERVFDRTFRQEGSRLIVPFGSFSAGEQKTLLVKLSFDARAEGVQPLGSFRLAYDDLGGTRGECRGDLSLSLVPSDESDAPLDPLVALRLQRSETGAALQEANSLFSAGNSSEAQKTLSQQLAGLRRTRETAVAAAPAEKKADVSSDFDRQARALDDANQAFSEEPPATGAGQAGPGAPAAAPPQPSRKAKAQVRSNAGHADAFSF